MFSRYKKFLHKNWFTKANNNPNVLVMNFPTEIKHNWGCKASVIGLENVLRKSYHSAKFKYYKTYFAEPKIPVPRDPNKFSDYIEKLAAIRWKEFAFLDWADIVIFDGEGTIHEHDSEKVNSYIYHKLLTIYAAKVKYGKKTMIVNHTVDFYTDEFKQFIKTIYPTCDYLSVREPKSQKLLSKIQIDSVLTADTAFLYTKDLAKKSNFGRNRFRIKKLPETPDKYYVFFISQLINVDPSYFLNLTDEIYKKYKTVPFFFVTSKKEKEIIKSIIHELPCIVVDIFAEPDCIINILKNADFCLSGRFHACVFSALANTPFIGFRSNTFKISGLIEALNYTIKELEFAKTPVDEIIETISHIKANKKQICKELEQNVLKQKILAGSTNVKKI